MRYSFVVAPQNTLRINLDELDPDYAIVSLVDFNEVEIDLQSITLYQFLVSVKKLGYTVEATFNYSKFVCFNENIPDCHVSILLTKTVPSLLVKRKLS